MSDADAAPESRLKFGIRIPPCDRADRVADVAVRAEALGFDTAWFPDSQLLWRDVFAVLGVVATRTERIRLGTAVTNIVTRHPAVLASAARTVAELADGRFQLGLGVGNSSVGPIGRRAAKSAEMREAIAMLRCLLAGEEWDFDGVTSRLRDPGDGIDIHLAASGPKNLALAGAVADGAILLSGISPETLAKSVSGVAEGARSAGRDPAKLGVTVSAFCHVTDDLERDARRLKPICAGIAQHGGGPFLALAGINVDVPPVIDGVYPDVVHAEDWEAAIERVSEWVSDEDAIRFAQAFCLFGTAEEIVARIRAAQQAGATEVFIQHVGSYFFPDELMEAFAGAVMPLMNRTAEVALPFHSAVRPVAT